LADITNPAAEEYARQHSSPEPALLRDVMNSTHEFAGSYRMLTGHLEGRFLKMLVAISGARRVLEIGTYTGYSALSMAEALPDDGQLISCEVDERHAALAREHIARSPDAAKIEVRVGPALNTIATLDGKFDLVFIDADKPAYLDYYEAVLPLLSERGFICVDNVLWSLQVLDEADRSQSTVALRAFNDRVANDPRVECVMVPIRDGVTIVRRV
jgi:caffeoyl-CoA O-methyltransferase